MYIRKFNRWQILAHVSPLPESRCALKDVEEFSGDCTEEFLQETANCEFEGKTADCKGVERAADREGEEKIANCEEHTDISREGSLLIYALTHLLETCIVDFRY